MYILDYDRQIKMIKEMTQLRKDNSQWVVYYHHPSTNEMWKSYFPKATDQKRGPKILRTEPVPGRLEDQLDECLKSEVIENAVGLGIELSVSPRKWEQVLSLLEQNYKDYNRRQLSEFLQSLGVENYQQLFEELNYSPSQFELTEEQLDDLAWRSKKLRLKRFLYIF